LIFSLNLSEPSLKRPVMALPMSFGIEVGAILFAGCGARKVATSSNTKTGIGSINLLDSLGLRVSGMTIDCRNLKKCYSNEVG